MSRTAEIASRYRLIEIQAGNHTDTATDLHPTASAPPAPLSPKVRTNFSQFG